MNIFNKYRKIIQETALLFAGATTGLFYKLKNFSSYNVKQVLMSVLVFLTVIGYNVMRGMKETILLQLPGSSAAYIPFVKIFLVAPISIIAGVLYLKLRHKIGLHKSYFYVTSTFLAYFVLFTFYLAPNHQFFCPDPSWIESMKATYPHAKYIFGILGNWPGSLYYVFAELWGTFTLVILFWSIANEMFDTKEATYFYPILSFIASGSIITASGVISTLSSFANPLQASTILITSFGSAMMLIVYLLRKDLQQKSTANEKNAKPQKAKMDMLTCLQTTIKTPHVLYMATCIIAFSILINIVETSLKAKLYHYYNSQQSYLEFYSFFTFGKGALSMLANVFNIFLLRRLGWFFITLITPILCSLTVNIFLSFNTGIFTPILQSIFPTGDLNYIMMWTGCYGMIATYASKYAFFDPTKEMAFIPLPEDIKAHGKAAADGLGGRMGKSGSGLLLSLLISMFAVDQVGDDLQIISPYLLCITVTLSIIWFWAVFKLKSSYYKAIKDREMEELNPITSSQDENAIITPPSLEEPSAVGVNQTV